jgi:predicted 2-oxoglutarate/Fe(II)-dependent dioxygenase YbiX
MVVNKYKDKVYEIVDFLHEDEKQILLNLVNNTPEEKWYQHYDDETWKGKLLRIEDINLRNLLKKLNLRIEKFFKNYDRINQLDSLQRFTPGQVMSVHTDDHYLPELKFGLVLYINENYEGGEIYYSTLNFKIKPKAGSLVIHPGDLPHQVLEVKNANRYMFTLFVHGKNSQINIEEVF